MNLSNFIMFHTGMFYKTRILKESHLSYYIEQTSIGEDVYDFAGTRQDIYSFPQTFFGDRLETCSCEISAERSFYAI